jgi:hypothetical protein
MGWDMACEAEAASPLTGRKFGDYHAAHAQRSASGQIITESNDINGIMHTGWVEGMQVRKLFESMIASKEPNHSLGGYSHREHWSCTQWKKRRKGSTFYVGYNKERQDKKQVFFSLYLKFFDYSLGGYSHWERCRAPMKKKLSTMQVGR